MNYNKQNSIIIKKLYFVQTCGLCPEEYDVYKVNPEKNIVRKIGYIRLRYGWLSCKYPNIMGKPIYGKELDRENSQGCFYSDEERMKYLTEIANKLIKYDRLYKRIFRKFINFFNKKGD